jgi:hypothetical protein
MKILRVFEYIAAVMIITGIVLGLGKVAVDQVVYMATRPACATVAIRPPSEDEKGAYLAGLKQSEQLMEDKMSAEMEAREKGAAQ